MGAHRTVTMTLSAILIAIGIAMIARTIAQGGGPAAYGVVVGACFVAAGGARLWLAIRGGRS